MKNNHENPMEDRDDIASLVRLAGKRKAVPRERAARVRVAAREVWQREVTRRSRRRYVWAAAGLAASVLLLIAVRILSVGTGSSVVPGTRILVEALAGPVWSQVTDGDHSHEPRALEVGDSVNAGTDLVTGEGSLAAIRLASGHSVRLDTGTTIRMLDEGSLELDRGAIYVDSGFEAGSHDPLDVHTPLGVIEEIGTQFEVRLDDSAVRVRLREGAVVVHHDNRTDEVRVGTELELNVDGSVTRREISTHHTGWQWMLGITPMPDLEGRTVRAFLDWVARERGWTLTFVDDDVARFADEVVVSGTTSRLTLDEALDAVLATSRMTYHAEHGVLMIGAATEQ